MFMIRNRQAMDQLTMEIRQAQDVTGYSTNSVSLSLSNGAGLSVTYTFSGSDGTLTRTASDGTSKVLVENCSLLNFNLHQRNPSNASFGIFPLGTNHWASSIKVVELTWKASLTNASKTTESENVQTARIVIRKQH